MGYLVMGFIALILIWAHYAVPKRIADLKKLAKDGVLTQAEVISARVARRKRGTPIVTLEYKYADYLGKEHKAIEQNVSSSFVESLSEGDKINIKYLTKQPKVNCLADKESPNGSSMWFGLFILLAFDVAIGYGIYSEFYANK